jgi:hypothetical protein
LRVDLGQTIVDPLSAASGQDVTFRQDVTASADATVLIDFELYDSQGHRVWQIWHDNQPVHPNATVTDAAVMTVPDSLPPGEYTFKTGIFSPGWGTTYAWNDSGGTLTISE